MKVANIKQNLDKIKERISNADFLSNKGLANEVGIHVFCYDPADELIVREYIDRFIETPSDDYRIIVRNLYKIFLEILEDEDVIDAIPNLEDDEGKESLLETLHNIASPEAFLAKMKYEPVKYGDVLFLTGVGEVFPFMRAHVMLETMQEAFAKIPIVMFYPGSFNGQDLHLFNRFFDDHHYRAFNLL